MDRDRHHLERVHHQRLPPRGGRQRRRDRGELVGQVQDRLPDGNDDPDDRGHRGPSPRHADRDVDRPDPHGRLPHRLSVEEQGRSEGREMMDDEKSMIDGNTVFAPSEAEQPVAAQAAARETVRLVTEQGLTLTTAESCTGGMLAAAITSVPGVSAVYPGGFVTYCDDAKHSLAGVSLKTLKEYTAVSSQTAEEMALGGAKRAGADVALSSTGIAGPGGTEEFPAGLVYIACAIHGAAVTRKFLFSGDRNEVRRQAVREALTGKEHG